MENVEKFKILIVEDEREIRELISLILLRKGYTVRAVESAELAYKAMEAENFELVVLDWMLPQDSGVDFLSALQKNKKEHRPLVIMVTAKAEPEDVIIGLDCGADDYLTKPFDAGVMVARVGALLRRARIPSSTPKDSIEYDGLIADYNKMQVSYKGATIELTNTEFRLLWVLISNPEVVLTREKIIRQIQGGDINVIGRTVDTHLFSLRKKLSPWSDSIITVRGIGYRFTPNFFSADKES